MMFGRDTKLIDIAVLILHAQIHKALAIVKQKKQEEERVLRQPAPGSDKWSLRITRGKTGAQTTYSQGGHTAILMLFLPEDFI